MGSVKGTRITANNKVEYVVSIDYEEALLLQGHVTNVHLFSEECATFASNILSRGKGETKYLRIPSKLAKDIRTSSEVRCLRLDAGNRVMLFTVIEK
jgi:hypothetical protein